MERSDCTLKLWSYPKKTIFVLSFLWDFAPVTRRFFAFSFYILNAADFNNLIRWFIVTVGY